MKNRYSIIATPLIACALAFNTYAESPRLPKNRVGIETCILAAQAISGVAMIE